jgi:hypothetical protein
MDLDPGTASPSAWRRLSGLTPLAAPALVALVPVLGIAARNPGQFRYPDLATILLLVAVAVLLATFLIYSVTRQLVRDARAMHLTALLTVLLVAWWFGYVPIQAAVSKVAPGLGRHGVLAPLGLVATVAAALWCGGLSEGRLRGLSGFVGRFALFLVAILGLQMLVADARGPRAARRSTLVRELAAPIPLRPGLASATNAPPRDIYLIVLDGHANARVLRRVFGYDNRAFEDSLRLLGFLVPADVRSNYAQTYLSVASLLNATLVTRLAQDAGVTSRDHTLPTFLVKQNRMARFLKAQGYRYLLFPSAWWAATANSPLADEEFDPAPGFTLRHELTRTELRLAVLRSSLARYLVGATASAAPMVDHFLRSFEGLARVPADPAPTFAFAHFLIPHIPYLLDAACRPLPHEIGDDMEADTPEQRADSVGQVRCADRLVLRLVTELLRRSSPAPIIIIVGDHGSRFADIGFYGHPDRVSPAFLRERFGAFGAFYLPAGGQREFREPITLVNVLGNVLRHYFGADLPRSPDSLYVSGLDLYRFYPVDPSVLASTGADSAKARRPAEGTP